MTRFKRLPVPASVIVVAGQRAGNFERANFLTLALLKAHKPANASRTTRYLVVELDLLACVTVTLHSSSTLPG